MAEQKKKKTQSSGAAGARTNLQKGRRVTHTANDKTPVSSAKSNKNSKKSVPNKKKAGTGGKRNSGVNFSEQYLPYIWGAIGGLLTVFFVCNILLQLGVTDSHLCGPVGYYICYFLFGLFGWAAYFIPLVLFNLAAFWRKYCEGGLITIKLLLSILLMIMVSSLIHVFVCAGDESMAKLDIPMLYAEGATQHCGGIIGGLVGYAAFKGLKLVGSIVLAVVVLPLIIMFLVGVTPAYVFSKIKGWISAMHREEDDEDEEDGEEKSRRKSRSSRRIDRYDDEYDDDTSNDDAYDRNYNGDDEDDGYAESALSRQRKLVSRSRSEAASVKNDRTSQDDDFQELDFDHMTGEVYDRDTSRSRGRSDADHRGSSDKREDVRRGYADVIETGSEIQAADDEGAEQMPLYNPYISKADNEKARQRYEDEKGRNFNGVSGESDGNTKISFDAENVVEKAGDEFAVEIEEVSQEESEYVNGNVTRTTMEVSYDDDAYDGSGRGKDDITVHVVSSTGEILTGTSDNHVDGLPEEEVMIPSEHHEEEDLSPEYQFPPIDLLAPGNARYEADEGEIARNTQVLRETLESFNIRVKEISCSCGPTITRFEVKPDTGVRVRSIANLVDDIALGLAKSGVRIEAPIPGKPAVGIEVPNANPSTVYIRNLIESPDFQNHKSRIASCLGADVSGRAVIFDINKMPHLLVAGATGMGKSVCINSIIVSILYKARPDEVKLILVDPKKVEFTMYRDIPHLYCPIVTDPKKAAGALNTAVNEMERRFELIEEVGVRNLAGYNEVTAGDPERPPLPQMVIIIDEFADLMMTAPNEVETAVCRLAQKARAAGIHLIIGTQRPDVSVITGLIKANIPSRIAFTVSSQIDSRTIIDTVGAEKLIGRGDMLYSPVGAAKPLRVQGAFISDSEVERVVSFVKDHNERPVYDEAFTKEIELEAAKCGVGKKKGGDDSDFDGLGGDSSGEDSKLTEAIELAVDSGKISTSLLQRRIGVGYSRAAKLIDRMEELGYVSAAEGNKPRKILITKQDLVEMKMNGRGVGENEEE